MADDWKNDRAALDSALADTDPTNPIAVAIADGIAGFTERLAEQARRNGKLPTELLLIKRDTIFDEMVSKMTLQVVADETGQQVDIHWVPREDGGQNDEDI